MRIPIRFSRPSGESGTGLTDRYRHNPYVRSSINIILLQVLLAILLLIAFGVALKVQQEQTVAVVVQNIESSVRALQDGTVVPTDLDAALEATRTTTLQYTLLGIVALTALFGFLVARYALRPTKNSLQFQKQFIGNMAHEVRTPLAIIKTNTEVALMDPTLSPDQRDTFTTTLSELDRIAETINNLLSFNKLVRPSRQLFSAIDATTVAKSVVERHEELAESRGIALSFDSDGPYLISGNQIGIDQVLTNLVKNAINYTPQHQGGSVSVTVRGDRRTVRFTVADTGIGIARKDLFYIFQPYFRADTSRVRNIGGGTSGLGLAIVNEIVKQHDGKIFVRSALNRGTSIEVTFPRATENGAEKARDDEEVEEVDLQLG